MDFSQILAKGISKIRGTDKDEEEVRRKALAFQKAQGQEAAPEEEPLEEGDLSDYVMPAKGGLKSIISKMKQKAPPTLDYSKMRTKPLPSGKKVTGDRSNMTTLDQDQVDAVRMENFAKLKAREARGEVPKGTTQKYIDRVKQDDFLDKSTK